MLRLKFTWNSNEQTIVTGPQNLREIYMTCHNTQVARPCQISNRTSFKVQNAKQNISWLSGSQIVAKPSFMQNQVATKTIYGISRSRYIVIASSDMENGRTQTSLKLVQHSAELNSIHPVPPQQQFFFRGSPYLRQYNTTSLAAQHTSHYRRIHSSIRPRLSVNFLLYLAIFYPQDQDLDLRT